MDAYVEGEDTATLDYEGLVSSSVVVWCTLSNSTWLRCSMILADWSPYFSFLSWNDLLSVRILVQFGRSFVSGCPLTCLYSSSSVLSVGKLSWRGHTGMSEPYYLTSLELTFNNFYHREPQ